MRGKLPYRGYQSGSVIYNILEENEEMEAEEDDDMPLSQIKLKDRSNTKTRRTNSIKKKRMSSYKGPHGSTSVAQLREINQVPIMSLGYAHWKHQSSNGLKVTNHHGMGKSPMIANGVPNFKGGSQLIVNKMKPVLNSSSHIMRDPRNKNMSSLDIGNIQKKNIMSSISLNKPCNTGNSTLVKQQCYSTLHLARTPTNQPKLPTKSMTLHKPKNKATVRRKSIKGPKVKIQLKPPPPIHHKNALIKDSTIHVLPSEPLSKTSSSRTESTHSTEDTLISPTNTHTPSCGFREELKSFQTPPLFRAYTHTPISVYSNLSSKSSYRRSDEFIYVFLYLFGLLLFPLLIIGFIRARWKVKAGVDSFDKGCKKHRFWRNCFGLTLGLYALALIAVIVGLGIKYQDFFKGRNFIALWSKHAST